MSLPTDSPFPGCCSLPTGRFGGGLCSRFWPFGLPSRRHDERGCDISFARLRLLPDWRFPWPRSGEICLCRGLTRGQVMPTGRTNHRICRPRQSLARPCATLTQAVLTFRKFPSRWSSGQMRRRWRKRRAAHWAGCGFCHSLLLVFGRSAPRSLSSGWPAVG